MSEFKTYIVDGVCNHYNQHLRRNIVNRSSIWVNCSSEEKLRRVMREMPGDDIIVSRGYEMYNNNNDDVYYNCEVYVKDEDLGGCLKYLSELGYSHI